MINLNTEMHYLKNEGVIAEYLAHNIFMHYGMGKIAVVTSNPKTLAQKTKNEWRAHNNDSSGSLRFSSSLPMEVLEADVTFATLNDYLKVPPICQILYITHPIEKQDLCMVTSWMPTGSTVIMYSFKP